MVKKNGSALVLLCVLFGLSWPASLAAQQAPLPVKVGDRIRISAQPLADSAVVAKVLAADRATLTLEIPPLRTPVEVPFSSVTSLELSHGKRSMAGRGAAIGGLGAAGFFTALYLIVCAGESGDCGDGQVFKFIGYTGFAGAAAGAAVGATFHRERWDRVELQRLRVGTASARRGLSITFRF